MSKINLTSIQFQPTCVADKTKWNFTPEIFFNPHQRKQTQPFKSIITGVISQPGNPINLEIVYGGTLPIQVTSAQFA